MNNNKNFLTTHQEENKLQFPSLILFRNTVAIRLAGFLTKIKVLCEQTRELTIDFLDYV